MGETGVSLVIKSWQDIDVFTRKIVRNCGPSSISMTSSICTWLMTGQNRQEGARPARHHVQKLQNRCQTTAPVAECY